MGDEEDPIADLASLVSGCRGDAEGIETKKHIVKKFVMTEGADLLAVMCTLHKLQVVCIPPEKLMSKLRFVPAKGAKPGGDVNNPGHFLSTALGACDQPADMAGVVGAYIASNPKLDQVALFGYVNDRGFVEYEPADVISVTVWMPPSEDGGAVANWRVVWGMSEKYPEGAPWYGTLRDARGRKFKLAFLGSVTEGYAPNPALAQPSEILTKTWKVPKPAMCISVDAGSMHPKQLDSINRMCNLPQFNEWVSGQMGGGEPGSKEAGDQGESGKGARLKDANGDSLSASLQRFRKAALKTMAPKVRLKTLLHMSLKQWRDELVSMDTDEMLGDGSINNIIFTKVKEVFAALLDAATLAGSWVIVDRTDGQGSATAELLLEMALERGTSKPTIVVIDSLERLGRSREGSRSHKVIQQLHDMYYKDDCCSQDPLGSEPDFFFDFKYAPDDYTAASVFAGIPDSKLPFPVLKEHQRKKHNNTCDPNRKWRYVYVDSLFSSGTHIVIKNNDTDEFNIEESGTLGFLYAHGDSRTYARLRSNIQQGKPIVMLHNSGGVVHAFAWLQRVMAFQRPPPDTQELGGPLRYIIANLSEANWTLDFGVPEMLMMRALAERAPMLFRKNVISVDILTESEEQVLEAITGCFAQAGGVPELGLGNAEVNVIFTTWMLHLTLCENARSFHRMSVVFQWLFWILSVNATLIAVITSSLGSGVLFQYLEPTEETIADIEVPMATAVTLVPIITALVVTITSRMNWRDKWSVCIMCADQLASEIYKFRMQTCEYDQSKPPGKDEDGNDLPPLSVKEKARRARALFVERVQAFHQACITELSQSSSLRPTKHAKKKKVAPTQILVDRQKRDEKPSLLQWFKLKLHIERHFFRSKWAFPQGISFLTWISGLRPYLSQRAMKEEMKTVITSLSEAGTIRLQGTKPLSEAESRTVRHSLAKNLGLPGHLFDGVKDEIRVLQRKVVLEIAKEREKEKGAKADREAEDGGHQSDDGEGGGGPPLNFQTPQEKKKSDQLVSVDAIRELVLEMQGQGKPREDEGEAIKSAKRRTKKLNEKVVAQGIDDDYLAGPLSIDSYMCYRVRPTMDMLEKKAVKLSWRLSALEIACFCVQSSGSVLGAFIFTEWVAVTVALAAVLQSFIEFVQLRNQVTSVNLALRDLQSLTVFWDSLSIVRRRTPAVKMQVVRTTEDAWLMVVDAHTTASSNTITSVEKKLAGEAAEAEAAESAE